MSPARHTTLATRLGPFTVLVDAEGAVLASGWTDDVALLRGLVHPALRPDDVVAAGDLAEVTDAVEAFHAGEPGPARAVPVRQRAGAFTEQLWERMREIEAGSPITYGVLAGRAGRPDAVRAAGAACAHNAATLFVPCHRVVRSNGGLGGYRWGLELKRRLQEMERGEHCRTPGAPSAP